MPSIILLWMRYKILQKISAVIGKTNKTVYQDLKNIGISMAGFSSRKNGAHRLKVEKLKIFAD